MEETEQSSGYKNDLDEESKESLVEKRNIFKIHRKDTQQHCDVPCGCKDKNFCGRKCECFTIKEDIRTLFSLGEFIDNLISGQKKSLQTPLEQSKPYKLLDMVFEMDFKFHECSCEKDEESNNSENELSTKKDEPPSCQCPDLPKKRCVLRLIRNDIYQRMKLVKKLNFLLMEKNKKIKEMLKKRERNDPCSPYVTKSVSFDEDVHKLVERYRLLKEMKEEDVPMACLFDKKELMEHIGHHRILTKPLRHIYLIEELASKVIKKTKKKSDSEKCTTWDESVEKETCRCPETDKKIEFIKNFKNMIARLNPILNREEETLDFTKPETETIEQLIKARRKEERQKLDDLIHKRMEAGQILIEKHKQLEEKKMLKDIIPRIMAYIKELEDELQLYKQSESNVAFTEFSDSNQESNEVVAKLTDEKNTLLELTVLLTKYLNRNEESHDDEKSLLEEINEKLQVYLERQRKYFDDMEKLIPGFKIAVFDDELQKDRIVADICRDDGKNNSISKEAKKSEPDGRERLRTLIKGLNKPHLHVIGSPLGRTETSQPSVGNNKKNLIDKLKKCKKKIDEKLSGEVDKCQSVIEKELLKQIENIDPELPNDEGDSLPNINCGEMVRMKLKKMAFEEGRKIVSQHDPFIQRQENLICRKRLVRELGLKCKKEGPCCTDKPGSSKLLLKAAYETKQIDCRCTNRLKRLSSLENDFEDIILQPEKHHIDYVSGSQKFINTNAIKRMRDFIHQHATKKIVSVDSDTDFISSLSKRKLTTNYNESRFSVVWDGFEQCGLFSINLEAQMMTNERIIIRPQYTKRVKVLSGGRLGLDPLYGEYVCTGMLDGVVLGNERNGPIPRTILQAIKELDSGEGVVIIILNENEERLSFLFAIERARKLGINAELVLARDDISDHQPEKWRYGCRGHTGIILQFKVAAAMAAKGYNLAAISRVTQGIQIATLDCYLTKYGPFIGSGIRSGRGYYIPGLQAEDVLSELLRQLMDPVVQHSIVPEPDTKMILIINKFRMSSDDVYSIISFVSKRIRETGAKVGRAYHGSFSAFTKQTLSITLAKDWNDELIPFLDFPTTCVHWPPHQSGSRDFVMTRTRFHRDHIIGGYIPPENVSIVFEILDRTLREIAFTLDEMLEYGKTIGVPLRNVVWVLKPNLKRLPIDRPYLFLCLVGKVMNVNMPVEGKFFHLLLVAAAQEFMKGPDFVVSWRNWCKALKKGTQSFAGYTKFKVGDGTILDYLMPITDSICDIKEGWSPLPFLYGGLQKVKHLEEDRKYDIGIMILGQLFRNIYSCLNEYVGHYPGEFWWKVRPSPPIFLVNESCKEEICTDEIPKHLKEQINKKEKEWVEYHSASSSVYSVKDDRKTEPSIEAVSLEEVEGDTISLRSAAGILYEQLQSKNEHSDKTSEELTSMSDQSGSWKYLD